MSLIYCFTMYVFSIVFFSVSVFFVQLNFLCVLVGVSVFNDQIIFDKCIMLHAVLALTLTLTLIFYVIIIVGDH